MTAVQFLVFRQRLLNPGVGHFGLKLGVEFAEFGRLVIPALTKNTLQSLAGIKAFLIQLPQNTVLDDRQSYLIDGRG